MFKCKFLVGIYALKMAGIRQNVIEMTYNWLMDNIDTIHQGY